MVLQCTCKYTEETTETNKQNFKHTCISVQFAHAPLVCTDISQDLSGIHSQTDNLTWLSEQISGHILFLSSSLPRFAGFSPQLRKKDITIKCCTVRSVGIPTRHVDTKIIVITHKFIEVKARSDYKINGMFLQLQVTATLWVS